ncbi:L-threonine ammonia-lyase-like [Glandiceps talaboti]
MSVDLGKYRNSISEAYNQISSYIRKTPLEASPVLSERTGARVFLKLESEQVTGAFKARGASNKLTKLCNKDDGQVKDKHVITASSGNHGTACAYIGSKFGYKVTVYTPVTLTEAKETLLKRHGADIIKYGTDCVVTETEARKVAQEIGVEFISPYNDVDIICGQGTIGLEIYEDLSEVDAVFVPVGGGGLISGIATYLKAVKPSIQIIGVQPERNHVMEMSIKAGKILDIDGDDTICDGTAGGVEENAITFDICKSYVDKWVLVSEEDISKGVYFMIEHHHKIIETAAALSIGALLKTAEEYKNLNVVLIMCGANIAMDRLKEIINKYHQS